MDAIIFNTAVQQKLNNVANKYEIDEFNSLISMLFESLRAQGLESMPLSPSHRDLNRGNVLACEGYNLRIIDWEFFGSAYYNYDMFIFLSNYRHSQDFLASWERYVEQASRFDIEAKQYNLRVRNPI